MRTLQNTLQDIIDAAAAREAEDAKPTGPPAGFAALRLDYEVTLFVPTEHEKVFTELNTERKKTSWADALGATDAGAIANIERAVAAADATKDATYDEMRFGYEVGKRITPAQKKFESVTDADAEAEQAEPLPVPTPAPVQVQVQVQVLRTDVIHMPDILSAAKAARDKSRSSDRDRNQGMLNLCNTLALRGPARMIARPADLDQAISKFLKACPNMGALAEHIRKPMALAAVTGKPIVIPPVLLVGAPGVGKSHVASEVAKLFGLTLHTQSYAAQGNAGANLAGGDKHWGNAESGLIFRAIAEGDYANPVVLLDELDKASASHSVNSSTARNPLHELLPLLEQSTAKTHKDRFVEITIDARYVTYVATANSLEGLNQALLSRFKLILVERPTAAQALDLVRAVCTSVSSDIGANVPSPKGETLYFMSGMTPRVMRRIWLDVCSHMLALGLDGQAVTMDDLERAIGVRSAGAMLH